MPGHIGCPNLERVRECVVRGMLMASCQPLLLLKDVIKQVHHVNGFTWFWQEYDKQTNKGSWLKWCWQCLHGRRRPNKWFHFVYYGFAILRPGLPAHQCSNPVTFDKVNWVTCFLADVHENNKQSQ